MNGELSQCSVELMFVTRVFSFKMRHTNTKYERIHVHCIYANDASFLRFVNLTFKFCFWGISPRLPLLWELFRPPESLESGPPATKTQLCSSVGAMALPVTG